MLITALAAGVMGTIVMDVLNLSFARFGIIQKVEIKMIGRMAAGWRHGRLFYKHPQEMEIAAHEIIIGYIVHYFIGIVLAVPYLLVWDIFTAGHPSFYYTIAYGIATTAASWFFVYPSMGFGILGIKSPEGLKNAYSSLANHLFYGIGLALGIALM